LHEAHAEREEAEEEGEGGERLARADLLGDELERKLEDRVRDVAAEGEGERGRR